MWAQTERLYTFSRRGDRYRVINPGSDIWRIPPVRGKNNAVAHNAAFPIALADRAIATWARAGSSWLQPGATVCDPFAGSGTVAVAAMHAGLAFEGAEILAKYHKLAFDRLSREAGTQSSARSGASGA